MASKSAQGNEHGNEAIEELLDTVDKTLDRVKVLYEQYFLGIQKQPPTHLHTDAERKLRDLAHIQIRNTALRYRFAMIQQKMGSYNSYWRRTLRQIENGTYTRNLQKIGRQAARTGADIPDEILAAMPKRMRDQILRDREAALALARRRGTGDVELSDEELSLDENDLVDLEDAAPVARPADKKTATGAHILSEADADFDMDAFFADVQSGTIPPPMQSVASRLGTTAIPTIRDTPTTPAPAPASKQPFVPPLSTPSARPANVPPHATTLPLPTLAPTGVRPATPAAGVPVVPPTGRPITPPAGVPIATQPLPTVAERKAPAIPRVPTPPVGVPSIPSIPRSGTPSTAPSQVTRPNPVAPGAAARVQPVAVETMAGPFPREEPARPPSRPVRPVEKPEPPPAALKPPPGMSDADVSALYNKYIQAKQAVGEQAGPGAYNKLLRTINQQAPKIMEQYKAKGVDFTVVVKDNQVVIRAKPKS